jgi:hypothetical protein
VSSVRFTNPTSFFFGSDLSTHAISSIARSDGCRRSEYSVHTVTGNVIRFRP